MRQIIPNTKRAIYRNRQLRQMSGNYRAATELILRWITPYSSVGGGGGVFTKNAKDTILITSLIHNKHATYERSDAFRSFIVLFRLLLLMASGGSIEIQMRDDGEGVIWTLWRTTLFYMEWINSASRKRINKFTVFNQEDLFSILYFQKISLYNADDHSKEQ